MGIINRSIDKHVKAFCAQIGADPLLVQGAGGNVSWKDDGTLWVKASGTWLAEAESKEIFVPVSLSMLEDALVRGDYAFSPYALDGHTLRPSIETMLHALMPQKFVVHLHMVNAVAWLVRLESDAEIAAALADDGTWVHVDYYKPGSELAKAIHSQVLSNSSIQMVLMKNHGVLVGANTIEEVKDLLNKLSANLNIIPRKIDSGGRLKLENLQNLLKSSSYELCPDEYLNRLICDPTLYQRLKESWAICPDHVVFLGAVAVCVDDPSELPRYLQTLDSETPFIFLKGHGLLQILGVTSAKLVQLMFYFNVALRLPIGCPIVCLKPDEISSLLDWDAEKYRQSINR